MRSYVGLLFACAFLVACGGNNGGGNNGGSGGTGGGGTGGTGGGGSGGGGTGGMGGGGSGGTPDYVSGSRIKARVQSTADGAKGFAGFYDSQLGVPCAFNHAADDTLRCLPNTYAYVASYFSDSGCSTPLAYASFGCAVTYAQKGETSSSCIDIGYYSTNQRYRIYSVGSAYTSSTIWSGAPGSCSMSTTPTTLMFFNVGSEVPASTFAAGSVDNAP